MGNGGRFGLGRRVMGHKSHRDADAQAWIAANSYRRQTLPGRPRVLTTDGLRNLAPRRGRFEPLAVTLDPVLPRPSLWPRRTLEPYEVPGPLRRISAELADPHRLHLKALKRLMDTQPDWLHHALAGGFSRLGSSSVQGPDHGDGALPLPLHRHQHAHFL